MKISIKKITSLLLTVLMVLGLFAAMPQTASFAADLTVKIQLGDDDTKIERMINEAMMQAYSGDTITVTGNTNLSPTTPIQINFREGVRIVWQARLASSSNFYPGIYIGNTALLDLQGSPGIFEVAEGAWLYQASPNSYPVLYNAGGHEIVVSGGEVLTYNGLTGFPSTSVGIYAGTGNVTISGGSVTSPNGTAIYSRGGGTVRINGGAVVSKHLGDSTPRSAIDSNGTVIINGGLVFSSYRTPIGPTNDVIFGENSDGMVIGWDSQAGNREYPLGSSYDLNVASANGGEAKWASLAGLGAGITYKEATAAEWSGLQISGIHLTRSEDSVLESIEINTESVRTRYTQGDTLDVSGLSLLAIYDDGFREYVYYGYETTPAEYSELNEIGTIPVTVSYTDGLATATAEFEITVFAAVPMFEVGGVSYLQLQDAIDACPDDVAATVKLLGDAYSYGDWLSIDYKNLTFDLNGYDLRIFDNLSVYESEVDYTGAGRFELCGGMYVYNSQFTFTDYNSGAYAQRSDIYSSTVTINGDVTGAGDSEGGMLNCDDSKLTVNGNVTSLYGCALGISGDSNGSGSAVVINGNVNLLDEYSYSEAVMMRYGKGSLHIYGDLYSGGAGIVIYTEDASVDIYGNLTTQDESITVDGGRVSVSGNVWAKNDSGYTSDAVTAYGGATVNVSGNVTGGVYVSDGAYVTISGAVYSENSNTGNIAAASGLLRAFADNEPEPYDALVYVYNASANIGRSIETNSGVGLWADAANISVGRSIRAGNGVGIWAINSSDITVTGSVYAENQIDGDDTSNIDVLGVAFTGMELTTLPTRLEYNLGERLDLTGLVVTAKYSDESTAELTDYMVSPANGAVLNTNGVQTINVVYAEDGLSQTESFDVLVTSGSATLDRIRIANLPDKLVYTQGENLDLTGLAVNAVYSDETEGDITDLVQVNPANGATLTSIGTVEVTIAYTEDEGTETTAFNVTVNPPAHIHDYQTTVTEPTCIEQGFTTYTCACGDSYVDDYTPALGHDFSVLIYSKASTCKEYGYEIYQCSRCEVTETIALKLLDHIWAAVITGPTCTEQGFTTNTCSVCGDVYVSNYTAALGHDWDAGVVTIPATEFEDGLLTYTCLRCEETRTEVIPASGHEHSYTTEITDPTCTEQGYTTYTCTCGESYIDDYTAALGHDFSVLIDRVAPDCTKGGYEIYQCSRCGEIETIALAPLDHVWTTVITDPTCTEPGFTTYTCTVCGESYISGHTPALGHTEGAGVVTIPPTETTEGEMTYYCTVCGEIIRTVPIPRIVTGDKVVVSGVELTYRVVNGIAVLEPTEAQMKEIFKNSGKDIVIELRGFSGIDLYVAAGWFKDVDKTITIITANGSDTVKTKALWNNSGKTRLVTVRNGKAAFKNI